ncbi:DUF6684 family protein [Haloarchaeobius salinus]|uniref:DUF6684 family protein n=1 Tax=Haloarchaeobius salinus TaxID=1198298 RepID=UPI002109E04C|nr:DUF6684 family protein [Haloarchaeobius salinus]
MEQDRTIFDKDTFLDLTVNMIPLFIMAFFFVLFLPMVYGPFGWDSTYSLLQIGLILVPFGLLAILTYFSAVAIEGDANETEAREAAEAEAEAEAAAEAETADAEAETEAVAETETAEAEAEAEAVAETETVDEDTTPDGDEDADPETADAADETDEADGNDEA